MAHHVVWGHGRSWIVHRVEDDRITWASRWMPTRARAQALATALTPPSSAAVGTPDRSRQLGACTPMTTQRTTVAPRGATA
jgi:hypothetical protein